MEKELDPEVIKATQSSLGKYVKRPTLSEKLLKKPPFRFLHDIVTTVLKTTGFFEGLFEAEELISENVKDRDSKISFLNKVISVVGDTTGISLLVKPSKIVAGQEPERTNELLQCLAQALDKKLSSNEAVLRYKETTKLTPTDKKTKEQSKPVKKINDGKKLTATSTEKLTSTKRDTSERSLTRNDKDKTNANKPKQKENSTIKKESPPKKTLQQTKTVTKKNSVEKPQHQNENIKQNKKNITNNFTDNEKIQNITNIKGDEDLQVSHDDKQDPTDSTIDLQLPPQPRIDTEQETLNTSYTIVAENDLNSSLSSQDLMEVDNDKPKENQFSEENVDVNTVQKTIDDQISKKQIVNNTNNQSNGEVAVKKLTPHNSFGSNNSEQDSIKDTNKSVNIDTVAKPNIVTPTSVRPPSSRPGAPRLRDKHDNVLTGTENLIVGKVNIIVESTPNEEEEDTSIIIMEQHQEPSKSQEQEQMQLSSNQHGHLVQQILDSQKEFSHVAGKTEIEWQFGAQKAREAVNQEFEQLRFNIQALSRVANPLGKLLDHIQEDVEVMRQELQQWTKTYEETSKELLKQKTANEDSMLPLRTKLKQLDADIEEKRDKINDLKIVIHKNSSRIEKLLTCGNVQ